MLPLAPFRGCGCQASGDRLPSYPSPFPESPPYLAAVHPPLCGLGGPTRFWAVRCHYAQPARSEGNTGRPKQTPSVCASRGLAAQQEGLLEGAKVAEGQDSKCVSALTWVAPRTSVNTNSSFFFGVRTDQVSKLAILGDGARLAPGPGTHPTIQEGLKVTRGRHQVGPGEAAWETE